MALKLKRSKPIKFQIMKIINKIFLIFSFWLLTYGCNTDKGHRDNGSVMEESNKDDHYQMTGYGDSIPSDSIREAKRLDSIRISKSKHHNK
jgi:hypothetical protein